jgi:hypothetical protein
VATRSPVRWFRRGQRHEADLDTDQVRQVLLDEMAALPAGAVSLDRTENGAYRLVPRTADAFPVVVDDYSDGLHVFVADIAAPIEIAAPLNINYGKPNQRWDEDLREVVSLVATGAALVGRAAAGDPICLVLEGSRMGVDRSLSSSAARLARGAVWS